MVENMELKTAYNTMFKQDRQTEYIEHLNINLTLIID